MTNTTMNDTIKYMADPRKHNRTPTSEHSDEAGRGRRLNRVVGSLALSVLLTAGVGLGARMYQAGSELAEERSDPSYTVSDFVQDDLCLFDTGGRYSMPRKCTTEQDVRGLALAERTFVADAEGNWTVDEQGVNAALGVAAGGSAAAWVISGNVSRYRLRDDRRGSPAET